MQRGRKGQLTVMILLGLLIIIAVAFLLYRTPSAPVLPQVPHGFQQVLDDCLSEAVTPGVHLLARQGGYILNDNDILGTYDLPVAYHWNGTRFIGPTLRSMEEELQVYVAMQMELCIHEQARLNGTISHYGTATADINILQDDVDVSVHYPVEFFYGTGTVTVSDARTSVALPLGRMYATAKSLGQSAMTSGMIPTQADGVQLVYSVIDAKTLLYTLTDAVTDTHPRMTFRFATREAP